MTPDGFIDDVARAMTEVDAPVDLRSRVLSQLDSRAARRSPSFAWSMAAAATVVVALVAGRPWLTSTPKSPGTPAPDLRNVAARPSTAPEPSPAVVVLHRAAAEPSASPDELAWLARAVPPLVTRDVVIPAIQPVPVSIAPIAVEPIELDPISMPPVGGGTHERR